MSTQGEVWSEVLVNNNSFKSLYLKAMQDVTTPASLEKYKKGKFFYFE